MDRSYLNKLTDYFIRENHIDITQEYEVVSIPARQLLSIERFDLMAKWIYIDAREKGIDMAWANKIYKDNINAFTYGRFIEPGSEKKNSLQIYIQKMDELIEDIRKNGFDENKSLIPVGKNDVLLDGAHRVAVAAYYNKNVSIIRFPNLVRHFDYDFFKRRLMSEVSLGAMANTYAHISSNCYLACVWPIANKKRIQDVKGLIKDVGGIVYEQDVYLTYRGICNFMAQIYGNQTWVGTIEDHFNGVNAKARKCFVKNRAVHTFLFCADDLESVLKLKSRIRDLFKIGNHSIHISDNKNETEMMTELLFNKNSVQFMNFAEPYKYSNVFMKLNRIKEVIKDKGYDSQRFIIDSSSVLEVCGLRQARDVDYLSDYSISDSRIDKLEDDIIGLDDVDNHVSQLKYYNISPKDMLYIPDNYFYFNEMKFISINRLIEMKTIRGEKKDKKDVRLLNGFVRKYNAIPRKFRYDYNERINLYLIKKRRYNLSGSNSYEYLKTKALELFAPLFKIYKPIRKCLFVFKCYIVDCIRAAHIFNLRKSLKNKDISIISSNCNGGVICKDLGVPFNSPFVNLFIKADDYVKMCSDLKAYMSEELRFVKERDPIYGDVSYPTAYLRDVKIYFMHYLDESEAALAWKRRAKRINWDNLFFVFTDRSGCTQKDLEDFDRLPLEHKVVFTHVPHPEIKSAFYIKGYENEDKVGVLSAFENEKYPVKRVYEQFDIVGWFNGK